MEEERIQYFLDKAEKLCKKNQADKALNIYLRLFKLSCNVYSKIGYIYAKGIPPVCQNIDESKKWLLEGIKKMNCSECIAYYGNILTFSENRNEIHEGIEMLKKLTTELPGYEMLIAQLYMSNDTLREDKATLYSYLIKSEKIGYCLAKTCLSRYYFEEKRYIKGIIKRFEAVFCVLYSLLRLCVTREELNSVYDLKYK